MGKNLLNKLPAGVVAADTITKLGTQARAAVVISGSHGGDYPGYLAVRAGVRAVILHDAGVGKDRAGIASLDYCQGFSLAAATVDYRTARIGDTQDMLLRGRISYVNAVARATGCEPGMNCLDAATTLLAALPGEPMPTPYPESRHLLADDSGPFQIVCLDSVSFVQPEDAGRIVLTGSHGGVVGGNKAAAIRVAALAAVYNDAGIGIDNAGLSRLPVLAERGIFAATVAAASARIGDGRSSYCDGVISAANALALNIGVRPGMSARDFVDLLQHRVKSIS